MFHPCSGFVTKTPRTIFLCNSLRYVQSRTRTHFVLYSFVKLSEYSLAICDGWLVRMRVLMFVELCRDLTFCNYCLVASEFLINF